MISTVHIVVLQMWKLPIHFARFVVQRWKELRKSELIINTEVYAMDVIELSGGKKITMTQIQEAAGINVIPLKHGYWKLRNLPMETYYDCSVCGCEKPVTEYDMTFCPFCGAVMDDE